MHIAISQMVGWLLECYNIEESPGSTEKQWWVTPTEGDFRESATENNRQIYLVRVKRRGKSTPHEWQHFMA